MSAESGALLLCRIASEELPLGLLPWVPLMGDASNPSVIEEWKRLGLLEPDSRRRSEYGGLALIFAELTPHHAKWVEALKEWNVRESKIVNQWKSEGRVEARREDVLKVLQARFPEEVPEEVVQRVNTQEDRNILSDWLIAAATVTTIDQFRAQMTS